MNEREVRERFNRIIDGQHQCQSLMSKKQLLEKQQMILEGKKAFAHTNLIEEKKDVEALETMTFSSIVDALLIDKVEKLAKEQEELYVASLQYEKLKDELQRINSAILEINSQLGNYTSLKQEYDELLQEMIEQAERETPETPSKHAGALRQMLHQAYRYEMERRAMQEVVSEGEWLITEVNVTRAHLEKAYIYWKKAKEGHALSTIKEYTHIDEAQNMINRIQWGLRQFHNALNRIQRYNDEEIKHFLNMPDEWICKAFQQNSFQNGIESFMASLSLLVAEILEIDQTLRRSIVQDEEKIEGIARRMQGILNEI